MRNQSGKVTIILAGGEAKRFFSIPKALLEIGEETILERQVRQSQRYCRNIWVVTRNDNIKKMCNKLHTGIVHGYEEVTTQKAIHNTKFLWGDRTFFLWGDVIFSKAGIDTVFTKQGFHDFGSVRQREGFAFAFDKEDNERFAGALEQTGFKDWLFYRQLAGIPLDVEHYEDEIFVDIDDWTTDIDNPGQYIKFLANIVNGGLLDDKP